LVDPDNRRPVDYRRRREVIEELQARIDREGENLAALAVELLAEMVDGRIKAYVTQRTLRFRREQPRLFGQGGYLPLEATGARREHVCAFARFVGEEVLLVVVPR